MPIAYSADALIYNAGSNSWSLRPDYDASVHRVDISITDDDGFLDGDLGSDEVGSDLNQTAVVTDLLGNPIASGQVYDEEFYAVWDGVNPHIYIERIEIGGVHVGYIVSAPLAPGTSYSQSATGDVDGPTAPAYSSFTDVPCFAPGTLIATPNGSRAVESIRPGDAVWTLDHGAQTVLWVHQGDQPLEDAASEARPVLIRKGALGPGRPAQDLVVSPQHRILVGEGQQLPGQFRSGALAPAKSLCSLSGVRHMAGKAKITWIHFACARHEVVMANGCLSESLLLGPMVVNGLNRTQRQILIDMFGASSPSDTPLNGPAARDCLTVRSVQKILKQSQERMPPGYIEISYDCARY